MTMTHLLIIMYIYDSNADINLKMRGLDYEHAGDLGPIYDTSGVTLMLNINL